MRPIVPKIFSYLSWLGQRGQILPPILSGPLSVSSSSPEPLPALSPILDPVERVPVTDAEPSRLQDQLVSDGQGQGLHENAPPNRPLEPPSSFLKADRTTDQNSHEKQDLALTSPYSPKTQPKVSLPLTGRIHMNQGANPAQTQVSLVASHQELPPHFQGKEFVFLVTGKPELGHWSGWHKDHLLYLSRMTSAIGLSPKAVLPYLVPGAMHGGRNGLQDLQWHLTLLRPKIIVIMGVATLETLLRSVLSSRIHHSHLSIATDIWNERKGSVIQTPFFESPALCTYSILDLIRFPKHKQLAWTHLKTLQNHLHKAL